MCANLTFGDPCPHDHVLMANLVEMLDERGGWKAADTTLWREHLHAATMVGRVAAAGVAVELGYGIEADPGPSGRLGHWRIAGVPDEVIEVHSKRAAEIDAECERRGESSYQARQVAARATRKAKKGSVEADLVAGWRAELAGVRWPVERLADSIDIASDRIGPPQRLTRKQTRQILSELVAAEGGLARRKVFCRRDVIVALAPHLYGQDPRFLELLADLALADPEVIPLVAVKGAREQGHALASVIAKETAIAESLARQLERTDAPTAPPGSVDAAIASVEAGLGKRLSDEQRSAAVGICSSGRGGEIVVGVAVAGKTTMLRAVAAAFDSSGQRVLGTATSGQAAQNLGREAGLGESRTLASLIWRLDNHQLRLDHDSVVLCDGVGMTDDVDLVRLTFYVEAAGAKLVLISDHRQLGAVGLGGALQGLVARHADAVHGLTENRRQHDPDERAVLGELRDGDVTKALSWYETHGRIHAVDDRDRGLQAAVDAWAADVTAGHDASLYAWRRANVAALNQRAREWMNTAGRLSGPEVICPGGLAYRAGDQVVTLAPGPRGQPVTSQRATVETVDAQAMAVMLRTDDGRLVTLAGEQAAGDKLDYSYATTVHRSQGATVARAHLYADGGGRELAYVAMSRAQESTRVWSVADDVGQAVEDLRRDWTVRRSPTWAIDTGTPHPDMQRQDVAAVLNEQLGILHHHANTLATAVAKALPPDLSDTIDQARRDLQGAEARLADLQAGRGAYRDTPAGQAVRNLAQAQTARQETEWEAQHAARWRDRRAARKDNMQSVEQETQARQNWQLHVPAEIARLKASIEEHQSNLDQLTRRASRDSIARRRALDNIIDLNQASQQTQSEIITHRNQALGIQPAQPRLHSPAPIKHPHTPHPAMHGTPEPPQRECPTDCVTGVI
jgi:hypothetical protein